MAIIKNEETAAQPKSPQAQQFVAPQAQPQPQVNVNTGPDIRLSDIRNLNFSRQETSGTAGILVQHVKDRVSKLQGGVKDITNVYLYQAPQPTHYPQIVITRDFNSKGKHFVIVYSFLIEAGAPKPPPRPIIYNGQQYNLVAAPSDTVTSGMIGNLINYIQSIRGGDTLVASAGFAVLPTELDIREGDDISRLANHICYTAETAIVNEAAKYNLIEEIKANANIILQSGFPVIGKDTSPPPLTDIAGLPIRSDFSIRLGQKAQENISGWDPNVAPRPDLTMVHGYVDLVRRDLHEPTVTQVNGYNRVLDPKYNKFAPKAVITKVDVLLENAVTSEMILLALSTANFLSYRGNWLDAFHPRSSRDDINLRDVTAIGYDSPLMESNDRLNVQGMSDLSDLNSLLLTAISPDLLFSIDYEEATDQSWKLADFYYAAGGTKNSDPTAKANIIRAADNLTFGKFSQIWVNYPNAEILYDENNRIALGYWIDRHNEKRDIRELDYLAMLNFLGDRDHNRVQDWDDTFNAATGVPLDVRLERRERIARELISSYTLKGWARRLTFNALFLETLNRALVECKVIPTLETAITDLTGRTMRGNPAILAMAMQNDPGTYGAYSAGRGQGGLGGIGAYGVAPTNNFRGFGN